MILSAKTIKSLCIRPADAGNNWKPMITNFVDREVREGGLPSYGLTSEGYDVRARREGWMMCDKNRTAPLDTWKPDASAFIEFDVKGDIVEIPPHSMVMGRTENGFHLPSNVLMGVYTKSSFARCAVSLNTTKAVPTWSGEWLVVEITNNAPFPVRFNIRGGIASLVFFGLDGEGREYRGLFSGGQDFLKSAT